MAGVANSEAFSPPWAGGVELAISKSSAVSNGAFFAQLRTALRAAPKPAFPANTLKESSLFAVSGPVCVQVYREKDATGLHGGFPYSRVAFYLVLFSAVVVGFV